MAQPEGTRPVKVGVLLDRRPGDLGEWLADGTAFEAAGADALWVDPAAEPELPLDPFALTAALAAVTARSLLVATLPVPGGPSPALARTLATIGRLSRGRLRVLADAVPAAAAAEAVPGLGVFRRIPGHPESFVHTPEPAAHAEQAAGPDAGPDEPERWVSVPSPDSRAAWRATLLDASEHGTAGLLVPAGPRLLDILRNPDDPGHRRDLQLAQG